jgi:hypothetical protein
MVVVGPACCVKVNVDVEFACPGRRAILLNAAPVAVVNAAVGLLAPSCRNREKAPELN